MARVAGPVSGTITPAASSSFTPFSPWAKTTQTAEYAADDAQANSEGADYTAQANADSANKTNALAQTLAQARNSTPGGGIRMGIQGNGPNANTATSGLTAANAAGRVARSKTLLRAQTDAGLAQQQQGQLESLQAAANANAFNRQEGLIQIW
jgi:hypothetical protein